MIQSQSNTKNPNTPTLDNPVGIDRVIQTLQVNFGNNLAWLEKSFGRAFTLTRKNPQQDRLISNDNIYYPAVYQGIDSNGVQRDFEDVLVNDNLDSYCFFRMNGDEEAQEYSNHVRNRFEADISIIFWFDLDRINKRLNQSKQYPYQEELNQEIQLLIEGTVFSANDRVELQRIIHNPRDIFREYTIDIVDQQNLSYPSYGLRYDLRAFYLGGCE